MLQVRTSRGVNFLWMYGVSLFLSFYAALFSSGCSHYLVKKGYESADTLVVKWVDDYFDLTAAQKEFIRARVRHHLVWHKQEALNEYIVDLRLLIDKVSDRITAEEIDWAYERVRLHEYNLMQHVNPDIAEFFTTLETAQLSSLHKRFERENVQVEKKLKLPFEKRLNKRKEGLLESAQHWLGHLQEPQKQAIMRINLTMPDILASRHAHNVTIQNNWLQLLASHASKQAYVDALNLLNDRKTRYSQEALKNEEAWQRGIKDIVLACDNSASNEQRQHLVKKLRDYVALLETLAAPVQH